eukprot:6025667-Alexandrium_andersonii.AAC.1
MPRPSFAGPCSALVGLRKAVAGPYVRSWFAVLGQWQAVLHLRWPSMAFAWPLQAFRALLGDR